MSYTGFRLTGRNATTERPADKAQAVPGATWARDRSAAGSDDGTEIDATWVNRLRANLEALVTGLGGDLSDGDLQLLNAVGGHVATAIGGFSVSAATISDSTAAGRAMVTAADVAAQRTLLGIGTLIVRERLTASRTYYVRTDGNDANNGLANTSGGAFRTIQKALNVVLRDLDLAGYDVTISVGDGQYTENLWGFGRLVGGGTLSITGNTTTPGNVVVAPVAGTAFLAEAGFIATVRGFRLAGASNNNLWVRGAGTFINFGNVELAGTGIVSHLRVERGAIVTASWPFSFNANAAYGIYALQGGLVQAGGLTITLTGTPAFSTAFAGADVGTELQLNGNTFSGSATGPRYVATGLSLIQTYGGGASYLPGDSAGSTSSGAVYA